MLLVLVADALFITTILAMAIRGNSPNEVALGDALMSKQMPIGRSLLLETLSPAD